MSPDGPHGVSHRVIADHLRSSAFLIADGVLPSNEGRGYVLRRIMRRGMRHAHLLGAREPMMHKLVPTLVQQMGQAYPELIRAQPLIEETLKLEETRFRQTLERGLKLLDEETGRLGQGTALPGARRLHPLRHVRLPARSDPGRAARSRPDRRACRFRAGDGRAARQSKARAAWSGSGEAATEQVWFELREQVGATEFLGYSTEAADGQVRALVVDGKVVESASAGQQVALVVNQTPFYAESGGQMGDAGVATRRRAASCRSATRSRSSATISSSISAPSTEGTIKRRRGPDRCEVDGARRCTALRANHSATHLLHEALRRQLGTHVTQKGSLVAPERLRFDISHNKPLLGRRDP